MGGGGERTENMAEWMSSPCNLYVNHAADWNFMAEPIEPIYLLSCGPPIRTHPPPIRTLCLFYLHFLIFSGPHTTLFLKAQRITMKGARNPCNYHIEPSYSHYQWTTPTEPWTRTWWHRVYSKNMWHNFLFLHSAD